MELTRSYTVIYVETREKSTAKISPAHRFRVDEIASDIIHFAEGRIPESVSYVMAGYSLGATVIAEAFPRLQRKPEAVILIEPNSSFPFNGIALFLARLAKYLYRPVVPFVKWYLRTFMIDVKSMRRCTSSIAATSTQPSLNGWVMPSGSSAVTACRGALSR